MDRGTRTNILQNGLLKSRTLDIRHYHCTNLPRASFKHPEYRSLIRIAVGSNLKLKATAAMHVLRLAAVEGLIHLHRSTTAAHLHGRNVLEDVPQPLKHEPCTLLSDAQIASNLVRANAVLAVHQEPQGAHPLAQVNRAVLKNGALLHTELLAALVALPPLLSIEPVMLTLVFFRSAVRADGLTINPTKCRNR